MELNLTEISEYRVLIVITPESRCIVNKLTLKDKIFINEANTFMECLLKG